MIMKARSRKGGGALARYLLSDHDRQQAFVIDLRGSVMNDLDSTLRSWEAEALAITRGEKPLYHMVVRLAPGETLERSQWHRVLAVAEKRLKLTDHPRVVVAHDLDGDRHLHVVYSRLDSERGTLLNMGHDRKHMLATCRQMEREYGLRELESKPRYERGGNEKTRSMEHRMAKESGTTRQALCDLMKAAWNGSTTGREFEMKLVRFGVTMTPGTSRDYNVWYNGKRYDPVRLLEEVRTAEFRAKMQLDPPLARQAELQPEAPALAPHRRAAKDRIRGELTARLTHEVETQTPATLQHEFLRQVSERQPEKQTIHLSGRVQFSP